MVDNGSEVIEQTTKAVTKKSNWSAWGGLIVLGLALMGSNRMGILSKNWFMTPKRRKAKSNRQKAAARARAARRRKRSPKKTA